MPPEGRFTTPPQQNAVFSDDFNDGIITNAMCVREALIEVDLISASPDLCGSNQRILRHGAAGVRLVISRRTRHLRTCVCATIWLRDRFGKVECAWNAME